MKKVIAFVAALLALWAPGVGLAATITVNTASDENNSDGDCSLREAIRSANGDSAIDACTAGSGTDVITLPAGTYSLTIAGGGEDVAATGDLDITSNLTISGTGVVVVLSTVADRVFDIDPASGGITAQISGVTIQGGQDGGASGGGLINRGTLTLSNCTIQGNRASSNGGGISNLGTLTVDRCTLSDNQALTGGGILVASGTVTVKNSTISNNRVIGDGGGISSGGTLNLNNVTITNNKADCNNETSCDADGDGAGEGGGIFRSIGTTVNIKNSLVGGNTDRSPNAPDKHHDCSGTINSQDYNLIQVTTGCTINGTTTHNITLQDPKLGALANNGGATLTHALLTASPALDAGNPATPGSGGSSCEATDQRGFNRPGGSACDIGAFEVVCGNVVVEALEACDDGNSSNNDSCLNTCANPSCGDGFVRTGVEGCDDGNVSNTDACLSTCVSASCGDGNVRAGVESCDDANTVNNDSCTNVCASPTCGDGIVQTGEECDNGGSNSNTVADACRAACLNDSCGDDVIDTDEGCDDGNASDGDGCNADCGVEVTPDGSEVEEANPDVDFDALEIGEAVTLNAPDPRGGGGALTLPKTLAKRTHLPDTCTCAWSVDPATLGTYATAGACHSDLTLNEAGSGTLTIEVDCGSEGSGAFQQAVTVQEAVAGSGDGSGDEGVAGGCSLIPHRETVKGQGMSKLLK